ncbi:MAG: hypothetical protein WA188_06680 [Terriglobales bacterium]
MLTHATEGLPGFKAEQLKEPIEEFFQSEASRVSVALQWLSVVSCVGGDAW